jgi:hypothetical protein
LHFNYSFQNSLMKNQVAVLSVKFQSVFAADKLLQVCKDDLHRFEKVPGLVQKYYLNEESTGALSDIYFFDSKAARAAYLESDIAKSVPATYGVIQETLRVEQFETTIIMKDTVVV